MSVIQSKAKTVLIKLSGSLSDMYIYVDNVVMVTAVHMDYKLPLKQVTSFQLLL